MMLYEFSTISKPWIEAAQVQSIGYLVEIDGNMIYEMMSPEYRGGDIVYHMILVGLNENLYYVDIVYDGESKWGQLASRSHNMILCDEHRTVDIGSLDKVIIDESVNLYASSLG